MTAPPLRSGAPCLDHVAPTHAAIPGTHNTSAVPVDHTGFLTRPGPRLSAPGTPGQRRWRMAGSGPPALATWLEPPCGVGEGGWQVRRGNNKQATGRCFDQKRGRESATEGRDKPRAFLRYGEGKGRPVERRTCLSSLRSVVPWPPHPRRPEDVIEIDLPSGCRLSYPFNPDTIARPWERPGCGFMPLTPF